MNCLLMRELPMPLVLRLWDTYLAEARGFERFHVYVCAALLLRFAPTLKGLGFQEFFVFLQHLPTAGWGYRELEEVLAQAFVYLSSFDAAKGHLG
jgi:hypothetical protein